MSKEKMTAIIGIRVYPSWKEAMRKDAASKGKTLSEYLYELIESGRVQVADESRKPHTTLVQISFFQRSNLDSKMHVGA